MTHKAHLHWQKTKIQKTWVCTVLYTARKTHNIQGFWHEKRPARKNPESHTVFLVSGAHARLLSTFDRYVVRITVAGRGRVNSAEGHVPRDQKPE